MIDENSCSLQSFEFSIFSFVQMVWFEFQLSSCEDILVALLIEN